MNWITGWAMVLMLAASVGADTDRTAVPVPLLEDRPSFAVSIMSVLRCLKQIRNSVGNHQKPEAAALTEIACDIPVNLNESDLDALVRTAVQQSKMGDNLKSLAERYSSSVAKTLTNFHGASCRIRIKVKRAAIMAARKTESSDMQLAPMPADCDVVTGSGQTQKLKFSFSPRIKWVDGCVSEFWLNMGDIDAGCSMCYVDRLYLTTNLVSTWANKVGPNARELINRQLGGTCW